MSEEKHSFAYECLHADGYWKPLSSHSNPIFQTSAFLFESPDQGARRFAGTEDGGIYSRLGNPTVQQLEKMMTALEEGEAALAYSSGMGAVAGATFPFLKAGDHIICGDTLYACTTALIAERFPTYGIEVTLVDTSSVQAVKDAIKPNTKVIYFETPANPTCKITDVEAVSKLAHDIHALSVVDTTFATPYNMKPLKLGADIVVHSLTKYLNGHGDVVGGLNVLASKSLYEKMWLWRKDGGAILGPFDAWLVIRGLRTLHLRMAAHNKNAQIVAEALRKNPAVSKVYYPGFEDHPNHDIAAKQMTGYGSTFSFCMKGGFETAKKLLEHVKVCTLAVSLGNPDTLIEHPASMTHSIVSEEILKKQGLTRDMIRISVGLEEADEIVADLEQAIAKAVEETK